MDQRSYDRRDNDGGRSDVWPERMKAKPAGITGILEYFYNSYAALQNLRSADINASLLLTINQSQGETS